jgi:hypothetical protein
MNIKEYLESTFDESLEYQVRDVVTCKDGFSISIQGGTRGHYCRPRARCNVYLELELGYPSELDDLISKYAECENTIDTVFAFVPISVVEKLIEKHGGVVA